ncbi:MAG: hypothetical protein HQL72_01375 [Magnetococcales bacterium]|nr:hypothetical protein [Magnetococcales bacterium]
MKTIAGFSARLTARIIAFFPTLFFLGKGRKKRESLLRKVTIILIQAGATFPAILHEETGRMGYEWVTLIETF